MTKEVAVVIAQSATGYTVETSVKSACSGCQQKSSCANGQVASALPQQRLTLTIASELPLSIGEKVVIELPENDLSYATKLTYLSPLFGLMFGAAVGHALDASSEGLAILLGFGCAWAGFAIAKRLLLKRQSQQPEWLKPQIIDKACSNSE